jgi:D-glycero-beta-D-manno-heptose-7-phosphate kinase
VATLTLERAEELLATAGTVRALVIGDLMIDRYVSGVVDRVSPEAPVPVVRVERERAAIGGAGNVAANVVALGASSVAIGCVGDDEAARTMRRGLDDLGVATEGLVTVTGRSTTEKTRVMARHQQIVRFDREDDADVDAATASALIAHVDAIAPSCDVLVMEDYNKGVLVDSVVSAVHTAGLRHDVPTIVDPKRRRFFAFGGVTVFKPNAKELEDALGDFIHPDDAEWMEQTRLRLDCTHLLLTLGDQGVAVQSATEGHLRVAAVARSVYDVSGAGDTVTAVVATVLAAGGTVSEAAVLANHAAAVGLAKSGVAPVSAEEILDHMSTSTRA